jgi:hypothetical protein
MSKLHPCLRYDHPSRNARALASGRLSLLLALEVALTGRAAADRDGPPRIAPPDCRRRSRTRAPGNRLGEPRSAPFSRCQYAVGPHS